MATVEESASDRGWGSPASQKDNILKISWTQARGTGLSIPVNERIAALVPALIARLGDARGRDYSQYGTWGYAYRYIAGTTIWSNHAWGLAIDLEAPQNPQGSSGYGTQPQNAGAIAAGLGFRWGGSTRVGGGYVSNPDPMHYEFMGTPELAAHYTDQLKQEVHMPLTDADISKILNAPIDMGGGERATVAQMLSRTYRGVGLMREFDAAAFSSLSHGTRPDNVTPNGQGIDQVMERLAKIEAKLGIDPSDPVASDSG
jgi:hypothetical protein